MSKYSLLSISITNVAVVAILTASISAAHPGSPPPDCTASGQRFATAAFLVSLHGLGPDNRVCMLPGQLFCGLPTQTADNEDSLSDNPDDLLRHAPPVYNSVLDPRSQLGRSAKRVFDVACLRTPACEPKPKRARTIPFPVEAAVCQIAALYERGVPPPTAPKPDAPPQGEGGTERPLARCDEARGPSLYVGDCSLQAW